MIIFVLFLTGCVSETTQELTREQAVEIEEKFFNMLMKQEKVGDTDEIKNYQSKEALIKDISEIADKELATYFVNNIFEEKGNKLYVIPKGGPAMLVPENYYDFIQVDENTYKIIQNDENMLWGPYTLTIEFKKIENKWKMANRNFEIKE